MDTDEHGYLQNGFTRITRIHANAELLTRPVGHPFPIGPVLRSRATAEGGRKRSPTGFGAPVHGGTRSSESEKRNSQNVLAASETSALQEAQVHG